MSYILIPRIEIFGANAQSAYPVVTGPSPLAFLGFARKLLIDLGVPDSENVKVAILHHDIEMRGEGFYNFIPAQCQGAALTTDGKRGGSVDYVNANDTSMSLQPTALCNMIMSLIITGLNDHSEGRILDKALALRIAGGHIRNIGRIRRFDEIDHAVKRAGSGFFITERDDLLDVSADRKIDGLLRGMSNYKENKENKEGDGWILPVNLGFLPITPFTDKLLSSRGGFSHAYVEPLIGMIQYRTRRMLIQDELPVPFWHYGRVGSAFVATTK